GCFFTKAISSSRAVRFSCSPGFLRSRVYLATSVSASSSFCFSSSVIGIVITPFLLEFERSGNLKSPEADLPDRMTGRSGFLLVRLLRIPGAPGGGGLLLELTRQEETRDQAWPLDRSKNVVILEPGRWAEWEPRQDTLVPQA